MFPCLELIIRVWRGSSLSVIRKEGFLYTESGELRVSFEIFLTVLVRKKLKENKPGIYLNLFMKFFMNFVNLKLWILVL